jgi:hypothetical protein
VAIAAPPLTARMPCVELNDDDDEDEDELNEGDEEVDEDEDEPGRILLLKIFVYDDDESVVGFKA